ncbi:hypothetical protein Busp01_47590 [Trinickia caryophylli]|nr:hypothetical protein Busp01_47590 [Trinickia caryophylli]
MLNAHGQWCAGWRIARFAGARLSEDQADGVAVPKVAPEIEVGRIRAGEQRDGARIEPEVLRSIRKARAYRGRADDNLGRACMG